MHSEKLQQIVNHLLSYNPELTGFVFSDKEETSRFKFEYGSFYLRIESEEDKTVTHEELEGDCSEEEVSFDFKLVLAAKCYNNLVLKVLIDQIKKVPVVKIKYSSPLTEHIYKEETDKDLQRKDLQLYTIYANIRFRVNIQSDLKCANKCEINLADCGC